MTETDPVPSTEPHVLQGDEAVALWRKGRGFWNQWIDKNPTAEIDFSEVDFTGERDADGKLSFSNYRFGEGNVSFDHAIFGSGDVSFYKVAFVGRSVSFSGATFDEGKVSFDRARFGNGTVSFDYAKFGNSSVSFLGATFGVGEVLFIGTAFGHRGSSFRHANFGGGHVCFDNAIFGDARASFSHVTFGDGTVSFEETVFGDGGVDFSQTTFGKGDVSFIKATFGNGDCSFRGTKFGAGIVLFDEASFGAGEVSFQSSIFENLKFVPAVLGSVTLNGSRMKAEGPATFKLPPSAIALNQFDLRGAVFDGPLTLEGELTTPPDLRSVKAAHHVELSGLTVSLRRIVPVLPRCLSKLHSVAKDKEDAARLRRLKEIAETNRDHRAALRFSADENRGRRWHETPWLASVLDMGFSFLSDYGQSIWRPTAWLFIVMAGYSILYWHLSDVVGADLEHATLLSLGNSLPFLPQSRTLRIEASEALFCNGLGLWIDIAMVAQGIASVVLLFLIGLGLRNRFRL